MRRKEEILRLDKLLAEAGFGTRSQVKRLIRKGHVTVNGEVVKDPAYQVDPESDEVLVDGEPAIYERDYYLILNKPEGYVTSTKDRELTVMELVSDIPRFEKLFPVGRLDKDAEGLLLMTTDGELAHRLTHPKWKVPKTYEVVVEGRLSEEEIEPLRKGIELKEFKAQPAVVEILEVCEEESRARITIKEGKYHQVKRMFAAIGHPVKSLKRVKFGSLELGELPPGEYRHLTDEEVDRLRREVSFPLRGVNNPQEVFKELQPNPLALFRVKLDSKDVLLLNRGCKVDSVVRFCKGSFSFLWLNVV